MSAQVLSGQLALVTGGARGIGRAISQRLSALGATVAVNYSRSAVEAEQLVSELTSLGGKAFSICFDVSNEEAVESGVKEILKTHSAVDILVNNAGIAVDGLLVRTKTEDWKRILEINLSGGFYCSRAVAKSMMKARRGRIINISSIIGETGNAGQVGYSASKSGVFGLTKSLARELGSRGITVNAITPGYIKTEMTSGMTSEQTEQLLGQISLGRLGEPEDVAELVAFLASPQASYITGQIIGVNGGMHM